MEQPGTFKTTAVGGFDKQSVLKYIDELCERGKRNEDELNRKLLDLEEKNKGLTGTVSELNERIQQLDAQQHSRTAREQSLEQTITGLQQELRQQRTVLDGKERELRAQQDKCRQLLLRAEQMEEKGRKYDDSVLEIGAALVQAQQGASEIIRKAEEKASRLTAATLESIQSLTGQIGTFKGDVSALRLTLKSSIDELEHRLDAIDGSIDTLDTAVRATDLSRLKLPFQATAEVRVSTEGIEETNPEESTDSNEYIPAMATAGTTQPGEQFFW